MPTIINFILNETQKPNTREFFRNQVIVEFLKETPGTGSGNLASKYEYNVEPTASGHDIFLQRPAQLNKGMDFTIRIRNWTFSNNRIKDAPRHDDIINDLIDKKNNNPIEYQKVAQIINMLYLCQQVPTNLYTNISFNIGLPIETTLKAIKWLFIEQDVTYWNWSGRAMFYEGLKGKGLC